MKHITKKTIAVLLILVMTIGIIPVRVFAGETSTAYGLVSTANGLIFTLLTEIPDGLVTQSWVDIEYIAIPSPGAVITEVSFTRNNSAEQFLYIGTESNIITPRGELGQGRIFISTSPTAFEFIIRDSKGGEFRYRPDARPWYDFAPEVEPINPIYMIPYPGHDPIDVRPYGAMQIQRWFVANRLMVGMQWRNEGVTLVDIEAIGAEMSWRMVSRSSFHITFELPQAYTYEELQAIRTQLLSDYPELISNVWLSSGTDYMVGGEWVFYTPMREHILPFAAVISGGLIVLMLLILGHYSEIIKLK